MKKTGNWRKLGKNAGQDQTNFQLQGQPVQDSTIIIEWLSCPDDLVVQEY